jgi:hypothetical protein
VGKTATNVGIEVDLWGTENVVKGFWQIGQASEDMGRKVGASSLEMDVSFRRLMFASAGVIANSVQLTDIVDRMAKGQLDLSRGTLMLVMNFMQLASCIYVLISAHVAHTAAILATAIAEQARGIATAIADAIATAGLSIPITIAASAAAGAAAYAAFQAIPHAAKGGVFLHPTLALVGEREPEVMVPLSRFESNSRTTNVYINVNGAGEPAATGDAIVGALRRAGVI